MRVKIAFSASGTSPSTSPLVSSISTSSFAIAHPSRYLVEPDTLSNCLSSLPEGLLDPLVNPLDDGGFVLVVQPEEWALHARTTRAGDLVIGGLLGRTHAPTALDERS